MARTEMMPVVLMRQNGSAIKSLTVLINTPFSLGGRVLQVWYSAAKACRSRLPSVPEASMQFSQYGPNSIAHSASHVHGVPAVH